MQQSTDFNYTLGDDQYPDYVEIRVANNQDDSYVNFEGQDFTLSVDASLELARAIIHHYEDRNWEDA